MNKDHITNIIANEIIETINTKYSQDYTAQIDTSRAALNTIRIMLVHKNNYTEYGDNSMIIYVSSKAIEIIKPGKEPQRRTFPLEDPKSIEQALENIQAIIHTRDFLLGNTQA